MRHNLTHDDFFDASMQTHSFGKERWKQLMHVLVLIGDKATSWCTVFDYSVEVIVVAVSFFMDANSHQAIPRPCL